MAEAVLSAGRDAGIRVVLLMTAYAQLIITHIFWGTFMSHGDKPNYSEETRMSSPSVILSTGGSKNLWVMIR